MENSTVEFSTHTEGNFSGDSDSFNKTVHEILSKETAYMTILFFLVMIVILLLVYTVQIHTRNRFRDVTLRRFGAARGAARLRGDCESDSASIFLRTKK